MNRLSVALIFASDCAFEKGAIVNLARKRSTPGLDYVSLSTSPLNQSRLSPSTDDTLFSTSLILDRRKSLSDMVAAIRDVGGAKVGEKGRNDRRNDDMQAGLG